MFDKTNLETVCIKVLVDNPSEYFSQTELYNKVSEPWTINSKP